MIGLNEFNISLFMAFRFSNNVEVVIVLLVISFFCISVSEVISADIIVCRCFVECLECLQMHRGDCFSVPHSGMAEKGTKRRGRPRADARASNEPSATSSVSPVNSTVLATCAPPRTKKARKSQAALGASEVNLELFQSVL